MILKLVFILMQIKPDYQKEGFAPRNSEMAYSSFSIKTEKHSLPLSSSLFIIFQLPFFIIIRFDHMFLLWETSTA